MVQQKTKTQKMDVVACNSNDEVLFIYYNYHPFIADKSARSLLLDMRRISHNKRLADRFPLTRTKQKFILRFTIKKKNTKTKL